MKKLLQSGNKLKFIIISGYYDLLHDGHLAYINAAMKLGDFLIVIVNNDYQSKLKKGFSLLKEKTRVNIISNLKAVDYAFLSIDKDRSVTESLKKIYYELCDNFDVNFEMIFCNGGDIDINNCLEKDICEKLNIKMKFNVGGEKIDSSSEIIKRYRKNLEELCEKE